MQLLAYLHQTNKAWRVLTHIMPDHNIQPTAFHYAIVMAGFTDEGQYHLAMLANKRMIENNVTPTVSTRAAYVKAVALSDMSGLVQSNNTQGFLRQLNKAETELQRALIDSDPSDLAAHEPQKGLSLMSLDQAYPSVYFEFLIFLYGSSRAYDLAIELFDMHTRFVRGEGRRTISVPVSLLNALMVTHYHNGEDDKVEKCWELAELQALKFAERPKTPSLFNSSHSQQNHRAEKDVTSNIPKRDSSVEDKTQHSRLAYYRSSILSRPLDTYMRSLARNSRYTIMIHLVNRLISIGYTLQYREWNRYIQLLLDGDRIIDAFRSCETHLMPEWPGWNPKPATESQTPRTVVSRFNYMAHKRFRPGTYGPTYRTLVLLSRAMQQIRGGGREGERLSNQIRNAAPRTWTALMTMPFVRDKLQEAFLRGAAPG